MEKNKKKLCYIYVGLCWSTTEPALSLGIYSNVILAHKRACTYIRTQKIFQDTRHALILEYEMIFSKQANLSQHI